MDKFYTKPEVASKLIQKTFELVGSNWDYIIEPSAGNGRFSKQIPNVIALDIAPESPGITQQDFLSYQPPIGSKLVIGNPPFGRVSSIAVKFFNHAEWADVIAFIVPRTFRRVSIQNRLNASFSLIWDEDIPLTPCAFEPPMMAKCCFQIWKKTTASRPKVVLPLTHPHWDFVPYINKDGVLSAPIATFAVRAYGGKCGETTSELNSLRPKSWHFIKAKKENLQARFATLDYSVCLDTARQNSIGRAELIAAYRAKFPD